MKSSIYRDIIDEKVAEWRNNLHKLEAKLEQADPDGKSELSAKIAELRNRLDNAVVQLLVLDKSESIENTVETKDRILEIFSSIDRDFPKYEDHTPYML